MKLAVGVIHGMGSQEDDFADPLRKELTERFQDLGGEPDDLVFEPIYWAPVLNKKERDLWNKVTKRHDLGPCQVLS